MNIYRPAPAETVNLITRARKSDPFSFFPLTLFFRILFYHFASRLFGCSVLARSTRAHILCSCGFVYRFHFRIFAYFRPTMFPKRPGAVQRFAVCLEELFRRKKIYRVFNYMETIVRYAIPYRTIANDITIYYRRRFQF